MIAAKRVIESPCKGFVEKSFVRPSAYVYEWETLFFISAGTEQKEISLGASGWIEDLFVKEGDEIDEHTPLAVLKEDFEISGCD